MGGLFETNGFPELEITGDNGAETFAENSLLRRTYELQSSLGLMRILNSCPSLNVMSVTFCGEHCQRGIRELIWMGGWLSD